MIICGIDQSITSPAIVKYHLDDNYGISEIEYLGFSDTISLQKLHPNHLILSRRKDYKHDLDRFDVMIDSIRDFCKGAEYIAIEGYALNAKGKVFNLAEFCGLMKWKLVKQNGNKLRVYPPTVVKKYAGKGNYNKGEMYRAYLESFNKIDLSVFPQITDDKKGSSPLSDIVDAVFIIECLLTEIKLRRGLLELKDLKENERSIFLMVSKSMPINILSQDFIE